MNEFTGRQLTGRLYFGRMRKTCGVTCHTDFGKIILPFTLLRRLECALMTREVREARMTLSRMPMLS